MPDYLNGLQYNISKSLYKSGFVVQTLQCDIDAELKLILLLQKTMIQPVNTVMLNMAAAKNAATTNTVARTVTIQQKRILIQAIIIADSESELSLTEMEHTVQMMMMMTW